MFLSSTFNHLDSGGFSQFSLEGLFLDWQSVSTHPEIKYFETPIESLNLRESGAKEILTKMSGDISMSNITIYGFEDKLWSYWSESSRRCDSCDYMRKDTNAARFYGGFNARLRALEGKLNAKVDGQDKQCNVIGVVMKKNSVAHNKFDGNDNQTDNLNFFRLYYDVAFIWSPPIGVEIKNWTVLDDWTDDGNNVTRHYLEEMSNDSKWPTRRNRYHTPLFNLYVDSKCLGLTAKQVNKFNLVLSKHLDYKITNLVAQLMQQHFLIHLGIPHARYQLQKSGHPESTWALDTSVLQFD